MWETALAFAIWGGYGSVLTAGHIDPALTAIVRSAILGVLLTAASVVIGRVHRRAKASAFANAPADRRSLGGGWLAERRPPDITTAIPWGSGVLWISGTVMLVDEVLYSVSAVSGPVAIIGLAYGCVPLLTPLLSRLSGTDVAHTMRPRHWICLLVAFIGNAMVFSVLQAAQIHFTMAAVFAFLAGLLFTVMPVCSAKLQQQGLGTWAVLKSQGAVGTILSVPLLALLVAIGAIALGGPGHTDLVKRSIQMGAFNSIAFTMTPFYLWYRGVARCGVSRTSICAFAEPLVATLFSLFVLKDAPATPMLLAGAGLVLGAIAVSARSSGE